MEEFRGKKRATKKFPIFVIFGLVLFFVFSYFFTKNSARAASAPLIITYQGKLLISSKLATTTQSMYFILYDSLSGGTALYSASGTIASPQSISVLPSQGLFSVNLGATSTTNELSSAIFQNNGSIYLEVRIGSDTLTPRKQITAVPYAFNARYLDGVGVNTISSTQYIPMSDSSGNFRFNSTTITTSTITSATITSSTIGVANITTSTISALTVSSTITNTNGQIFFGPTLFPGVFGTTLDVGRSVSTTGAASQYTSLNTINLKSTPAAGTSFAATYGYAQVPSTNGADMTNSATGTSLIGVQGEASFAGTSGIHKTIGLYGLASNDGSGIIEQASGLESSAILRGSGNIVSMFGLRVINSLIGSGNATNSYGVHISNPTDTGGGSILTNYGIYLADMTSGNTDYSIYSDGGQSYHGGNFGIGVTTPASKLHVVSTTEQLRLGYDATNYTSFTIGSNGALTVSSTSGVTTTISNKLSVLSNSYFGTITSGTWNGTVIGVAYGGTNSSTIAANGSIIYSDGTRYNASAAGTSGQLLQSAGSGTPVWVTTTTLGFVNLQGATSGTQQTGHFNISGTGIIGTSLGINTTTPVASLAVQGIAGTNLFEIASSTGASLFRILTNGNVGINSNTPSTRLAVVGTSYFSQTSTFGSNISNIVDSNTVVSQIATTSVGYGPWSIFVSGRYVYTANNTSNTISVVDISNPSAPVQIATTSVGSGPRSIYVSGRYAYTANFGSSNISVVDISNPFAPREVATVAVGSNPIAIFVSGKYAYTANYNANNISVVDISNPAAPIQVTTVAVEKNPDAIFVSGRYAYIANNASSTISVVDISNPSVPVQIATTSVGSGPRSIYVSGRYAYVTNENSNSISVVDISNPSAPTQIATTSVGTTPFSIYVSGRYAYVANNASASNNISIVDVSNPSAPIQRTTASVGTNPTGIYISGRYGYVANDGSNNISVVDISGTEVTSLMAHSAEVGNIQSRNDIFAQGNIMAGTSLLVGAGGIQSQGIISVFASSTGVTSSIFGVDSIQTANIFKVFANGTIGIGTSTPIAKLTVQGAGTENPFSILTSTAGAGSMFTVLTNGRVGINSSSPIASLALQGTAGTNLFEIASSTGASLLRMLTNGNVGFNSSSPQATLGIDGTLLVTSATSTNAFFTNLVATNATTTNLSVSGSTNLVLTGTAGQFPYYAANGFSLTNTSTIFITPTSRIGIGTSTPIAKLTVQGAGSENPFSILTSTAAAGSMFTVLTNGNVGINSSTPRASFAVQGIPGEPIFLVNTSTGVRLIEIDSMGNTILQSSAGGSVVQISETAGLILTPLASKLFVGGTSPYIRAYTSGQGIGMRGNLAVGGTGVNVNINSEDTRQNTSGTSTQLQIQGTFDPTSGTGNFVGLDVANTVSTTGSYAGANTTLLRVSPLLTSATSTNTYLMDIGTNTAANGAGQHTSLFAINSAGRVGINSTSPIGSLAVQGTAGTNLFEIASSTGASLFRILTNGNVGINSNTPVASLAVQGKIGTNPLEIASSTGSSLFRVNQIGQTLVGDGNATNPSYSFASDRTIGVYADGSNLGLTAGGVVGVTLDSAGTLSSTRFSAPAGSAGDPPFQFVGDGDTGLFSPGANRLALSVGGTQYLTITTTGRVGINSSSPIGSLAVQGTAGTNPLEIASSTGASMLRLLQNNRLGINSSSPVASLAVQGTVGSNLFEIASSTGASELTLKQDGHLYPGNGTDFVIYSGDQSSNLQFNNGAGVIINGLGAKLLLGGTAPYIRAYSTGQSVGMRGNIAPTAAGVNAWVDVEDPRQNTSGTSTNFQVRGTFNPSSGTGEFIGMDVTPTVSTSPSSNSNYIAVLRVSPLVTAASATKSYLFDVGTNTAANGAGQHISNFVVNTDGRVGVNSSSPQSQFSVQGQVRFVGLETFIAGNGVCITATGTITNAGAAACTGSSIRYKENLRPFTGSALDTISKLNVVIGNYKEGAAGAHVSDSVKDEKDRFFLIAEEVATVDPRLVDFNAQDQPETLNFDEFNALYARGLQELNEKLNKQQTGLTVDTASNIITVGSSTNPYNFITAGNISLSGTNSVNKLSFATSTLFESNLSPFAGASAFTFNAGGFTSPNADNYVVSVRANNSSLFSVAANGDVHAAGSYFGASAILGTSTHPGDLAERVDIALDDNVEAGDVMVVDKNAPDTYRRSTVAHEQSVAGVISTNPTIVVGNGKTDYTAVLAMVGRVPIKVSNENGNIQRGDLLITASTAGYAMKYDPAKDNSSKMVAVIGVALEPLTAPTGKILSLIRTGWIYNRDSAISNIQNNITQMAAAQGLNLNPASTPENLNITNNGGQLVYAGGNLDLQNNSVINVAGIVGKDSKWRIDEWGNITQKIATAKGDKEIYGLQSTGRQEVVISGTSTLENGYKKVLLTELDQEIVDKSVPLKVSITMSGETKGVYVTEKNYDSFAVKENESGQSNAEFDWIVIAKIISPDTAVESAPVAENIATETVVTEIPIITEIPTTIPEATQTSTVATVEPVATTTEAVDINLPSVIDTSSSTLATE